MIENLILNAFYIVRMFKEKYDYKTGRRKRLF